MSPIVASQSHPDIQSSVVAPFVGARSPPNPPSVAVRVSGIGGVQSLQSFAVLSEGEGDAETDCEKPLGTGDGD